MAGVRDITIYKGDTYTHEVRIKNSANTAINITGRTYKAQMRKSKASDEIVISFTTTITDAANGLVTFSLTAGNSSNINVGTYYYDFEERLYEWQDREDYTRVWQTTDIINLRFESTFDPIIVQLLDSKGNIVIALPALVGLPNRAIPNAFSFEVQMSLATVPTGCYRIKIIAGLS